MALLGARNFSIDISYVNRDISSRAKKKLDKFLCPHIIQHTLSGEVRDAAVAQLAEHVFGKDEVTGSIPVSSS